MLRQLLRADVPVAAGHFQIDQDHIRLEMGGQFHGFRAVGRFADDFKGRIETQHGAQTFAHAFYIIGN